MPLHGGFSLSAQTLDNGACPEDLLFVKRCTWRIAAVAHCFDRLIDLAECSPRHAGVLPPLGKEHQGEAFVAKSPGPVERVPLGGVFLQRFAIRSDGLFQFWVGNELLKTVARATPGAEIRKKHAERQSAL